MANYIAGNFLARAAKTRYREQYKELLYLINGNELLKIKYTQEHPNEEIPETFDLERQYYEFVLEGIKQTYKEAMEEISKFSRTEIKDLLELDTGVTFYDYKNSM